MTPTPRTPTERHARARSRFRTRLAAGATLAFTATLPFGPASAHAAPPPPERADVLTATAEPHPARSARAAGAPSAALSSSQVPLEVVLADGVAAHVLAVTLVDAAGEPVTGLTGDAFPAEVQVDGLQATVGSFRESAPGLYYAAVTSTRPGTAVLTVSIDGAVIGAPMPAAFREYVAGEADAARSSVRVTPVRLPDGRPSHTVTIILQDAARRPVPGRAADLPVEVDVEPHTADGASVATAALESSPWTESAPGTYQSSLTSTVAGTFSVHARIGGVPVLGSDAVFTVTASGSTRAVDVGRSTSRVSGGVVPADGAAHHTLTVTVKSSGSLPVTGLAGNAFPATTTVSGAGATIGAFTEIGASGVYSAPVTSLEPGVVSIDVTIDGHAIGATHRVEFRADGTGQVDRSGSTSRVVPAAVPADGRAARLFLAGTVG
jgi:hypothetical protein